MEKLVFVVSLERLLKFLLNFKNEILGGLVFYHYTSVYIFRILPLMHKYFASKALSSTQGLRCRALSMVKT